jgi:hypothetical protein
MNTAPKGRPVIRYEPPFHPAVLAETMDKEWQATLAKRGWTGYITHIVGLLYRAEKIVDGVGVDLTGDTPEAVLAMIGRVEAKPA